MSITADHLPPVVAGPTAAARLRSATAAALGAAFAVLSSTAAVAVPKYTQDEPAIAVAVPAAVYLETTYSGYIRDKASGEAVHGEPLVYHYRCSGVVVNPDGYAVTTSTCVRPTADIVLTNALHQLGRTLVTAGELADSGLDSFVADLTRSAELTGPTPDSTPRAVLSAQIGTARSVTATSRTIPATVVHLQPAAAGNIALVRLRADGLSSVEVGGPGALRSGGSVVILGYSAAGDDVYTAKARSVEVAKQSGAGAGVSAGIGPEARGGAVVDSKGRLLGILDADEVAAGSPIRDVISSATVGQALSGAGVQNRLSAVDREYRHALAEYFRGHFSQAVEDFEVILRKAPSHATARTYAERARERRDVDGDAIANAANWSSYAVSAVEGVAIIAVIGMVWRFARRRLAAPRRDAPSDGPV